MEKLNYFKPVIITEEFKNSRYTNGEKYIVGEKVYYALLYGIYDGVEGYKVVALKEDELDNYEIEQFSIAKPDNVPHIRIKNNGKNTSTN